MSTWVRVLFEEVVDFLLAGGPSVLDAAVRPAGTSPPRPAAAPRSQQQATQEAGDQSANGDPGTAPLLAERIPGVAPDQDLGVEVGTMASGVEVGTAASDSRGWRSNPAYQRGGWRVKRADARKELRRATAAGDDAAVAVARDLLRREDHRAPADRSDARAADGSVAGSGRTGRRGQGGKGGRRSKARTPGGRGKRQKKGLARRGEARQVTVTISPAQTIRRSRARR